MSSAGTPILLSDLIDDALKDQGDLTAVDRFSQRHETELRVLQAPRYEELIPVGRTPGKGEQLAFRVDLDRCSGCKACVSACHSLNGLGEDETWRDVGLIVGEASGQAYQQTVTTACHHCADPACMAGCPVQAYEKDPATGIVRHLDDQCIGCQYCVLKCPYDVPKYDATRGIVRKCDMCADRLAEGEAPACVQGCPTSAISIEIVDHSAGNSATDEMIPSLGPSLPAASYTRPTTRYVTEQTIEFSRPASDAALEPGQAHDPLAAMLVLTQLSIGLLLADTLLATSVDAARVTRLALAAGAGALGLGAATLHLGRPLYAFRAMLGWRTSWMSREILAFGAYVPAALVTAALAAGTWLGARLGEWLPRVEVAAAAIGLFSLLCSIMIYVDTHRAAWSFARTTTSFTATAAGLGMLACAATGLAPLPLGLLGALALAGILAHERRFVDRMTNQTESDESDLGRSARLLATALAGQFSARIVLGATAAVCSALGAVLHLLGAPPAAALASLGLLLAVLSELLGRHLYFRAEAARAMPVA